MSKELIERELFYKVVALASTIHRELGQGLPEHIYKNALILELKESNLKFETNKKIDVIYKKNVIDTLELELIINNALIITIISNEDLKKQAKTTMLSILKLINKHTGLLLDYSHDTIYYKRVVYKNRKAKEIQSAY
jgi:GxxExxY protein